MWVTVCRAVLSLEYMPMPRCVRRPSGAPHCTERIPAAPVLLSALPHHVLDTTCVTRRAEMNGRGIVAVTRRRR